MAQHINLVDARLLPCTVAFGARHAVGSMLAVLLLGTAGAGALKTLTQRTLADTRVLQQRVASLQAAAASAPAGGAADATAELEGLRQLDAGQRRIRIALDAGVAGEREGPADYFKAMARQAKGAVSITGFAVADNGTALDIEGRMTEADRLTDYLRRLNQEPRFKGRSFAQLNLNGVDRTTGSPLPYTEFALRSRPSSGGNP